MELSSIQANEKNEKVKVSSAEIIVHGTIEKPYYEIKYFDLSDGQYHIGYSSYDLNNVFRWREECFEIVNQAADTIEALSAKLQAANMENGSGWILCKDRLPTESGEYIATCHNDIDGYFSQECYFQVEDSEHYFGWDGLVNFDEVIAWQNLPEPYRP